MTAKTAQEMMPPRTNEWAATLRLMVLALLLAFFVRSCLFQPFTIPSGSMIPSLWVGDYLFVNKFAYGYSRHSLPFSLPLFEGRLMARPPQRGDVAVFKLPRDGRTDFIKRIIGLPGDVVEMRRGRLWVNGAPIARERLDPFQLAPAGGGTLWAQHYRERFAAALGGAQYRVLDSLPDAPGDTMAPVQVPQEQYFVLGDNRDNSSDSRFASGVGLVPLDHLVGRASLLFFSFDADTRFWQVWKYPRAIRWGRLLRRVE
ncbi:MAG: signal peptidase I [Hyphomicrobiales bacterium]|nr:signal peptidase I [Hyphomicrobiales bacterium]